MDQPRELDERSADALLRGAPVPDEPALVDAVALLRSLADVPAPPPSAALAALLDGGFAAPAPAPAQVPARRRSPLGWALPVRAALTSAACLGLVLASAATGSLPAPTQDSVADVVERVTPLHLPRPHHAPAPVTVPSPSPAPQDEVQPVAPAPSPVPVATHEVEDRRDDTVEPGRRTTRSGEDDGSTAGDGQRREHRSGDDAVRPSTPPPVDEHQDQPDRPSASPSPTEKDDEPSDG